MDTLLSPFVVCGILTLLFAWGGKYVKILYLIALLVPGLWLMAPILLQNVEPEPGAWRTLVEFLRFDFAAWFWEPLSLWLITYTLFILRGHMNTSFYASVIHPRRSIWFVFGITVFLLTIWFSNSLLDAGRRVTGLRAEYEVLTNQIAELQYQAGELERLVYDEANRPTPNFAEVSPKLDTLEMQAALVLSYTRALSQSIGATQTLSETQFTAQESNTLRQIDLLVTFSMAQVDQIQTRLSGEQTPVSATSVPSSDQVSANDKEQLLYLTDKIHDATDDLIPVTAIISRDRSTTFAILTILFAIFLMNPWVLYFSFIISKRSTIARDNRATLKDLGLLSRFVRASVTSGDTRLAAVVHAAKQLEAALDLCKQKNASWMDAVAVACTAIEQADRDLFCQLPALAQLKESLCKRTLDHNSTLAQAALNAALDEAQEFVIGQRQFFSREYIIPLVILTFLTAVGWYYTLLPGALPGLVKLIQDGPNIQTVTEYLTQGFTPITASFAGAWLFTTLMLTIRWTNDDLYPRSFFYAAMRLVFAFLIGLLFTSWVTRESNAAGVVVFNQPPYDAGLLIIAFSVGAAPLEFVRAILRSAGQTIPQYLNKGLKLFRLPALTLPGWDSKQPLTELQDLTIWDDTRFFQEGIQNVHALAHGDLERLALNTPFAANTLIDWIDQAQLHVHATKLWQPGLALASIGAATELLKRCSLQGTEKFDSAAIAEAVASVNDAQQVGLALDDPRRATRDAGLKLQTAAVDLAESTGKARQIAGNLNSVNITQLKEQLGSSNTSVKRTLSALKSQCKVALTQLKKQDGAETRAIAQVRHALDNVVSSVSALSTDIQKWEDTQTLDQASIQATTILNEIDVLVASTNQAAKDVLHAVLPLQLTTGILRNILAALNADSNVKHLQRFRQSRVDLAGDHRPQRVAVPTNESVETNHIGSRNGSIKNGSANGQRSRRTGSQATNTHGHHSPDHKST